MCKMYLLVVVTPSQLILINYPTTGKLGRSFFDQEMLINAKGGLPINLSQLGKSRENSKDFSKALQW